MPHGSISARPHSFTTACGLITFTLGDDPEESSLDALPGYQASTMALALGRIALWGFVPLEEWEAPPQLLPNGGVRIWCAMAWIPQQTRRLAA